eukprot:3952499-Prymnesium_polylepis.1
MVDLHFSGHNPPGTQVESTGATGHPARGQAPGGEAERRGGQEGHFKAQAARHRHAPARLRPSRPSR